MTLVRSGAGSLATLLAVIALAFMVGCSQGGKDGASAADPGKGGRTTSTSAGSESPSGSSRATKPRTSRDQRHRRADSGREKHGGTRGRSTVRRVRRACARLHTRTGPPLSGRLAQDVKRRAQAALPSEQALAVVVRSAARRHGPKSLELLAQAHRALFRAYVQAPTLRGGVSRRRAFATMLRGLEGQTRRIAASVPAPECALALPPIKARTVTRAP